MDMEKLSGARKLYDKTLRCLLYLCAFLTCALLVFMIGYIFYRGLPHVTWNLISTKPSYLSDNIGILPDILNTLYIVIATLVIVLPLGVGAAIYLTEYARNRKLVTVIEFATETLTGIPLYRRLRPCPQRLLHRAHQLRRHTDRGPLRLCQGTGRV